MIILARQIGMMLINSLFITPMISRVNATATIFWFSFTEIAFLNVLSESRIVAVGVEILMVFPKNSDSAVADAPIIWFITSQAALILISSNTKSSAGGSSFPMRRFSTICISDCRNTITFDPEIPCMYSILTSIAGSSVV